MKSFLRSFLVAILWSRFLQKVSREHPKVITTTGSVGKTSAKEAIALVLEGSEQPVFKTWGGLNTEIGVPLSFLGFKEMPTGLGGAVKLLARLIFPPRNAKNGYYVLEYSADKPGDIAYLTQKLAGNIRVITKIAPTHMGAYISFQELVTEKLSLLDDMHGNDIAILNADDPEQKTGNKNVLWYGFSESKNKPGVWGREIQQTEKGLQFTIVFNLKQAMDGVVKKSAKTHSITVQTQLIGKHQLYSLLAAAAVAFQEGIPAATIKKQLELYMLPAGRGRLIEGVKGITIVDDTYNSSPESVKAGLQMLKPFAKDRRVVAILGTMNELGDLAEKAHQEVAEVAAKTTDYLIVTGPEGPSMIKAAKKVGMPAHNVIQFKSPEQLIYKIDQLLKKEDVVYIKGSQNNVRLERLVERIMAHPKQAPSLLVRQSAYWKRNQ